MGFNKTFGWDGKPLDRSVEPSRDDIIWAAGFYEGEGCVQRLGKSAGVAVVIGQRDPEMLYYLRDRWGGSIRLRKYSGANRKPLWVWYVCGNRARKFLADIYPWLWSRRRAKIATVLASESVETERQALPQEVKFQSALHGDMQKSAEMTDSIN